MYACLECGKKFQTIRSANNALKNGCPRCGGVDVDLAPSEGRSSRLVSRLQEAVDLGNRVQLEDEFGCDFPHLKDR